MEIGGGKHAARLHAAGGHFVLFQKKGKVFNRELWKQKAIRREEGSEKKHHNDIFRRAR